MPDFPRRLGLLPTVPQPAVKPMFRTLAVAASGMSAQRMRMEVVASNLANAETTHGPDGKPYQRKVVQLEAGRAGAGGVPFQASFVAAQGAFVPASTLPFVQRPFGIPAFGVPAWGDGNLEVPVLPDEGATGVQVAGIVTDTSEGPLVYEPGHPDADANGYVRYPNVRTTDEMIDLMDARRVYEANATVFQSAKSMLRRAIDI